MIRQQASDDERCGGPDQESCIGSQPPAEWPVFACARDRGTELKSRQLNAQARFQAAYARARDCAAAEKLAAR
ncbi:MAG: hypothetical protein ISP90_14460 [Nevskia sp.]|nr:hypothetical protein [Nevskia sp.]